MKEILSNGISWFFVPVQKACTYKINDNGHLSIIKPDGTEDVIFLSWEVWTIFSTLAEVLITEELAKEMVLGYGKDRFNDYLPGRWMLTVNTAIESLKGYCVFYSIDPSTHWLILKKEG